MDKDKLEKFEETLNQAEQLDEEQLYEMSMAWRYKNRRIDVCAWVENPMATDNQYFKYYNNSFLSSATQVARIRLDRPDYVGGVHRERNFKKWILSEKEKKELMGILQEPSVRYPNCNRWHEILITYNYDNFNLTFEQTRDKEFDKAQKDPKMPDYIKPFTLDTPMPNYLGL